MAKSIDKNRQRLAEQKAAALGAARMLLTKKGYDALSYEQKRILIGDPKTNKAYLVKGWMPQSKQGGN